MSAALRPFASHSSRYLCPECQIAMMAYTCDGKIVYKCGSCHGIWLADRRIGTLREALEKFDFAEFGVYLNEHWPARYTIHSCPRCHLILDQHHYAYNSGVYVHRCPRCKGMWLPLLQLIHLMQSLHLKQAIFTDVRGFLKEMNKLSFRGHPVDIFFRFLKSLT